jgi:ketosteroid isomerase-like protein
VGTDGAPETLTRYWNALERNDLEGATAFLHQDFVEDWPQSGERIVGATNWLLMARHHPTFPAVQLRRIIGSGDTWAAECDFDYPGMDGTWRVCALMELRDGLIVRMTEYFGAPFEAADWRADWVERI